MYGQPQVPNRSAVSGTLRQKPPLKVDAALLPPLPATIAAFMDEEIQYKELSTTRRRIEAVKFAYSMLNLRSPVGNGKVRRALQRAFRCKIARPKQACGLTNDRLARIIGAFPDDLSGKRDAAIVCVKYDSLARSFELSLREVEHVWSDGAKILISGSKTDYLGEGNCLFIATHA